MNNESEKYKMRFGNNIIINKERFIKYSSFVEENSFKTLNDAIEFAEKMNLSNPKYFASIFVKTVDNVAKYIVVPLAGREIAYNVFYEEAMDVGSIVKLTNKNK